MTNAGPDATIAQDQAKSPVWRDTARIAGYLYCLLTACFFGLGAVLANIVTADIDPLLTTLINLALGAALVGGYLALRRQPLLPRRLDRRTWLQLLAVSILGTGVSLAFVITGLSRTSSINGGFLIQLQGPAAAVTAMVVLGERIHSRQALGLVATLLGGVMVVMRTPHLALSAVGSGDVLVFIGAVMAGIAFIPAKLVMRSVPPMQLSFVRLLLAAAALLPVVLGMHGRLRWHPTTHTALLQILLAVTNFCLAYITLHMGLSRVRAWEAASVLQLEPVFTVVAGLVLLLILPTPLQFAGGAVMIAGGLVANLPSQRLRPQR